VGSKAPISTGDIFVGQTLIKSPEKRIPFTVKQSFTGAALLIEAIPQGPIKDTWKSAGWLQIFGVNGERIQQGRVLLGKTLIGLSSLSGTYTLAFEAKYWLPPLSVIFWARPGGKLPTDVQGNGPDGLGKGLTATVMFDTLDGGIG
jgi:hypothetical protein